MSDVVIVDLFAGAGGTSTGAMRAIASRGKLAQLVAVDHWPIAVATHTANHPGAAHYCMNLEVADPADMVPGRRVDLLVASPECVHFSRARGGKPVNDQRRSGAEWVLKWCERLDVRCLLIENVKEFMSWGDLDGVLHVLDIRFRMLKNSELAAAMGFPPDYVFTGTKSDVTRQIGNAVAVNLATHLVDAILDPENSMAIEAAG